MSKMKVVLVLTLLLGLLQASDASSAAPALPACDDAFSSLSEKAGLFRAGTLGEESVLLGEATRDYGVARRELSKQFAGNPELAKVTANEFLKKGMDAFGSPGAAILALDVLGKASPGEFTRAVDGILRRPFPAALRAQPEKLANVQTQLGSRMLGSLSVLPGADALKLSDSMARSAWVREFVSKQHNAARTMMNFLKAVEPVVKADPEAAKYLGAIRELSTAWIEPRRLETISKQYTHSNLPETDWAFALVLAKQNARFFEKIDPVTAQNFHRAAASMLQADVPSAFRENPRVVDLFNEFEITR
jgi:hypothetical protein